MENKFIIYGDLSIDENMCEYLSIDNYKYIWDHFNPKLRPVVIVLYLKLLPHFLEFSMIFKLLQEYSLEQYKSKRFWEVEPKVKKYDEYIFEPLKSQNLTLWKQAFELFNHTLDMFPKFDKCCPSQVRVMSLNKLHNGRLAKYKNELVLDIRRLSLLILINHLLKFKDSTYLYQTYYGNNITMDYFRDSDSAIWDLIFAFNLGLK